MENNSQYIKAYFQKYFNNLLIKHIKNYNNNIIMINKFF